jgi:uncharacterized repeat protein (TIGR01451 family)
MPASRRLASIAVAAALLVAGPALAQTRFVATTGTDAGTCVNPGTPCRTIQYAHGQANAGDTIQIAAGTYSESPRITKSVTLAGASAASTIIAPQLADQLPGPAPTPTNSAVILDIAGAGLNVTVRDVTVRFPSGNYPALGRSPIIGIWITGANATIRDTIVTEIHDADVSGTQTGNCIQAGSALRGPAGTVVIENNQLSRCQKTGIVANESGTVATIRNNTVIDGGLGERNVGGPRTQTVIAPNGIQVAFGARATIDGNTVRRMQCELPSPQCGGSIDDDMSTAAGILLFNPAQGTTVTNNTVETSDDGFAPYNPTGAIPVVVTGNTFRNNRWRNAIAYSGTIDLSQNLIEGAQHGLLAVTFGEARQAIARLNPANVVADANRVRNASINGLWIRGIPPLAAGGRVGFLSLDAESMPRAIAIAEAARSAAPAGPALPLIAGSRNQFTGSLVAGFDNQPDEGTGNLPCNWWGAATGPGTAGANPALTSPGDTITPFAINFTDYACPTTGPTISVAITKTGPATVNPGGSLTWIVTIINNGPADGAGSVFTDPVPAAITNVTWTCTASNGAACPNASGSGNNINQTIAVFPPGGQLVYAITGTVPAAGGTFTNVATITPTAIPGASAVSATAVTAGQIAIPVPADARWALWLLVGLLALSAIGVLARRAG